VARGLGHGWLHQGTVGASVGASAGHMGPGQGEEGRCAVDSRTLTAMLLAEPEMCYVNGPHGECTVEKQSWDWPRGREA
jgi:hypothetical protein